MTRTARRMAERFRPGVRVVYQDMPGISPRQRECRRGTVEGTVVRHVPGGDAQGGYVVVEWDNGRTGRHSCGTLGVVD